MRVKKAAKQLSKAESLISAVAAKYSYGGAEFENLLKSAKATLTQAQSFLDTETPEPDPEPETDTEAAPPPPKKQSQSKPEPNPKFTGTKTEFVRSVIQSSGKTGVTAREIVEAFSSQNIPHSKNLVYNALGALVNKKTIARNGDRYILGKASAKAEKKAAPAPAKKRISPEGMKRIIEANKKRWAAVKKNAPKKAAAR